MPFTSQTTLTTHFLPDDAAEALPTLIATLDSAKTRIRLFMYGLTHADLIDALIRAHARGVDVKCVLDYTQACGKEEVAQLHRLFLGIPSANIVICTSDQHQLMHLKVCVVDGSTIVEGSFNWSPSALKQMNSLNIFTDLTLAAAFETKFDAQVAWALAHEPQYQKTA